jgi:hypothetical protein
MASRPSRPAATTVCHLFRQPNSMIRGAAVLGDQRGNAGLLVSAGWRDDVGGGQATQVLRGLESAAEGVGCRAATARSTMGPRPGVPAGGNNVSPEHTLDQPAAHSRLYASSIAELFIRRSRHPRQA